MLIHAKAIKKKKKAANIFFKKLNANIIETINEVSPYIYGYLYMCIYVYISHDEEDCTMIEMRLQATRVH